MEILKRGRFPVCQVRLAEGKQHANRGPATWPLAALLTDGSSSNHYWTHVNNLPCSARHTGWNPKLQRITVCRIRISRQIRKSLDMIVQGIKIKMGILHPGTKKIETNLLSAWIHVGPFINQVVDPWILPSWQTQRSPKCHKAPPDMHRRASHRTCCSAAWTKASGVSQNS